MIAGGAYDCVGDRGDGRELAIRFRQARDEKSFDAFDHVLVRALGVARMQRLGAQRTETRGDRASGRAESIGGRDLPVGDR